MMNKKTYMWMLSNVTFRLAAKMGLSWALYVGAARLILATFHIGGGVPHLCDVASLRCEKLFDGSAQAANIAHILALMSTYALWVVHERITDQ